MTLEREEFERIAMNLQCEPEAIQAVAEVESGPLGAFLPSGHPVILFEPHKFHSLTYAKYDQTHPHLSYPKWGTFPYAPPEAQPAILAEACKLDQEAAYKSTSWGRFQIMGFNYAACGCPSINNFVDRMWIEGEQLTMFSMFIFNNPRLLKALRTLDWVTFAHGYNGPSFAVNKYDVKLKDAYDRLRKTYGK